MRLWLSLGNNTPQHSVKPVRARVAAQPDRIRPMITRQRRSSPLSRLWMPLLTAAFLGYFGYHAFSGAFGKWSMDRMKVETANLESQLATLKTERANLERKVALLRPESLDADVVDMEARSQLNMMRPDELVISFGATQHPAK